MNFERDHLYIDGRIVDVDATTLPLHGTGHGKETKPALRVDKVVTRVTERLQAAAAGCVPAGVTVVVTMTAPIKVAAQTTIAIEDTLVELIAHKGDEPRATLTGLGNKVQMQVVSHGLKAAPKLITLVHNPATKPQLLINLTREMLDLATATAKRRATARGVVIACGRKSTCIDAYRTIWSQLARATKTNKILMLFKDDRAELLSE